ncbi:hypothetical protein Aperf_G00000041620 [Anoplocephala perfoliata]
MVIFTHVDRRRENYIIIFSRKTAAGRLGGHWMARNDPNTATVHLQKMRPDRTYESFLLTLAEFSCHLAHLLWEFFLTILTPILLCTFLVKADCDILTNVAHANENSSNPLPKSIQVIQPVPAPSPSLPNVHAGPDQSTCLNPIIMTAPVSSPMVTYLPNSSGAMSIPQANDNVINSIPPGKPGLISSSPYFYQSIPFGQQFFLANAPQNGFVIAQPQGTSYMIAPPQPRFQVRPPSAGQPIPMTFLLGPQPASGLIHLPQQQTPANAIPAINTPLIPQGVAVAQLPNGCSIIPSTATSTSLIPIPATVGIAATTPSASVITGSVSSTSSLATGPTKTDPESVLRQLNEEISNLQRLDTPLTDQQNTRLEKLVDARKKVLRSIEQSKAGSLPVSAAIIRPTVLAPNAATATTLRPRPPGNTPNILPAVYLDGPPKFIRQPSATPTSSTLLVRLRGVGTNRPMTTVQPRLPNANSQGFAVRSEVVNLLMKHRLLPMNQTCGGSVLVEFRLNSQRYQLYLTRAQKAELESLLYTLPSNQKKADVLSVYQGEQMRFFTIHPRPAPPAAAQLRLLRPPANQIQSTPQPGFAQPPPRQPLPMCVLAPAPTSSASTSTDPTSKNLPLKVPLYGASTTLIRAPPSAPSPSSATGRRAPTVESVTSANQVTAQQLRRHNAIRNLLHADQMASNSRPPVVPENKDSRTLPTVKDLINLLAPYHVQQDMDNTPEALEKVDEILNKAFCQLNTRKWQTEEAVHSILCVEKWQLMECPSADRIPLTRLLKESDRERLGAEQAAFDKVKRLLEVETHPIPVKRIRQILDEAAPEFIPLEFDEKGNSRPAVLQFEVEETQKSGPPTNEELVGATQDSPMKPQEVGDWPAWKDDDENGIIADDDEDDDDEDDIEFQPSASPDIDIADVVVEDDVPDISLNNFANHEATSPLNGLPSDFLSPITSMPEMPRIPQNETTEEVSHQRLQYSEDPAVDAAIRSIIDL